MGTTWVVAANASRARIFAADKPAGALSEVQDLTHPASRLHDQEITSDLPGRSFDSGGPGRHAMQQGHDPSEQEAIRFAQELSETLETARAEGRFQRLYVIASPSFLGELRHYIHSPTRHVIVQEIDKDLTSQRAEAIREHLPERL